MLFSVFPEILGELSKCYKLLKKVNYWNLRIYSKRISQKCFWGHSWFNSKVKELDDEGKVSSAKISYKIFLVRLRIVPLRDIDREYSV